MNITQKFVTAEGKIITDQDLRESKQFHDEQVANSNYNLRQDLNILSDTLSDKIARLDIRVARLNVKLDSLIEELSDMPSLGNNGTTLQPNGEIK